MSIPYHALASALRKLEGRAALSWSGGKDSTVLLAAAADVWRSGTVVVGSHGSDGYPGMPRLLDTWRRAAPHLAFVVLPWRCHLHDLRVGGGVRVPSAVATREREDRAAMRSALAHHGLAEQILGLRGAESRTRARRAKRMRQCGYCYRGGRDWGSPLVHAPLLDWTDDHVWAVLDSGDVPTHPHYARVGRHERSHPCLFMPHSALNQRVPWSQCAPDHYPEWWAQRCEVTPGLDEWTVPPDRGAGW